MPQFLDDLIVTALSGAGIPTNREQYPATLISLASYSIVQSTSGFVHAMTVMGASCPTITFFDNASGASGPIIANFPASAPVGTFLINKSFTGLTLSVGVGVAPQLLIHKR